MSEEQRTELSNFAKTKPSETHYIETKNRILGEGLYDGLRIIKADDNVTIVDVF